MIDATGLETRHISRYFLWTKSQGRFQRVRWPKLTVVCHAQTHLIAGLDVSIGPSQDSPQFPQSMREAARLIPFDRLLADKGYDAEHNHVMARQELGITSTIIAVKKKNAWNRKWPKTRYRRALKKHFPKRVYGQRWQVESLFSRIKRRLGPSLTSKNWPAQVRECHLRVLTHNFMILSAQSP